MSETKVRTLGPRQRLALIRDVINAEHDLLGLGEAHRLSADDLAAWIDDPANRQCLMGLCLLADVQTQVQLSRYRLLAANRLIRLATDEQGEVKEDVARRACVDLLKLDLKRATPAPGSGGTDAREALDSEPSLDALRAMLYGSEHEHDDEGTDA